MGATGSVWLMWNTVVVLGRRNVAGGAPEAG